MKCFLDKNLADYGNHFFWDIPVERGLTLFLSGRFQWMGKTFATKILLARFAHTCQTTFPNRRLQKLTQDFTF